MAKSDYYPKGDAQRLSFWSTLMVGLPSVATTVGVMPADSTALQNKYQALQGALEDKLAKRAAAQSATAAFAAEDRSAEDLLRATVRRIKAHPAYTVAIGQQLGIEGPESAAGSSVGGEGPRPDLEAVGVLSGEVTLSFVKHGYSGVEIRSKRGSETDSSFLARDTEAPYIDTRENLSAGPETRQYVAQYLQKDGLVGQVSDVLVVTVPGA